VGFLKRRSLKPQRTKFDKRLGKLERKRDYQDSVIVGKRKII